MPVSASCHAPAADAVALSLIPGHVQKHWKPTYGCLKMRVSSSCHFMPGKMMNDSEWPVDFSLDKHLFFRLSYFGLSAIHPTISTSGPSPYRRAESQNRHQKTGSEQWQSNTSWQCESSVIFTYLQMIFPVKNHLIGGFNAHETYSQWGLCDGK